VFCRCYGYVLKKAQEHNIKFEIQLFRRPYKIENVNYKKAVEELYATDLDIDNKKHIPNKTSGLLEKKYNTSHLCKIFNNLAEAQFYQVKYGERYTLFPK